MSSRNNETTKLKMKCIHASYKTIEIKRNKDLLEAGKQHR